MKSPVEHRFFSRRLIQLEEAYGRLKQWRLWTFLVAVAFSTWASTKSAPPVSAWAAGVAWSVFIAAVIVHRVARSRGSRLEWRLELEKRLNALKLLTASASAEIDESTLEKVIGKTELGTAKRLIRDLDVGQFVSMFPFFLSSEGRNRFISFLVKPELNVDEIRRRQNAIGFWERHPVLRRKVLRIATAMESQMDSAVLLRVIREANAPEAAGPWLVMVGVAQVSFFALWIGGIFFGTKVPGLLGLAVLGLAYAYVTKRVDIFSSYPRAMQVGRGLRALKETAFVLRKVGHLPEAQVAAFSEVENPIHHLQDVERAAGALGVRQNPILALLINFLIPWDLFWTLRFDRARRNVEKRLPQWLDSLAELEAYIAFAEWNKAHGVCLPQYLSSGKPDAAAVTATKMAHPLLSSAKRVANNLQVNSSERCHLVTGSNMSGKSTFLRSVGLNLLLAQAGAKVVADQMVLSPVRLESSMRPSDSLADGFSSFYAEVADLVEILKTASRSEVVFYLIDEIFRGTNNRERRIGAESVIRSLSETTAMGMVTTHDLDLSTLEGQVDGLSNHHFRDDVIEGKMMFTYEYRKGPCPSTNAIKVMRSAGLKVVEAGV
ncbi:MAG: hypothetical protein J0L82_02935 [Deltaproteobacteria bacterium]|nr:hypothetical protein [Deltaproteobacteria bacterium]